MNRGMDKSYNQLNGSLEILNYYIDLFNTDNNILIEIPLIESAYGNINLKLIYNHQNRNDNSIFGKGFKLNYYSYLHGDLYNTYYDLCDKTIYLTNIFEVNNYITYIKYYDEEEEELESLNVSDYYGNELTSNINKKYPNIIYNRNGSTLIFEENNSNELISITDNLTNDKLEFTYTNSSIEIKSKFGNTYRNDYVNLVIDNNGRLIAILYKKGNFIKKQILIYYSNNQMTFYMTKNNTLIDEFIYSYNNPNITSISNKFGKIYDFYYYSTYTRRIDKYSNIVDYYFKDNKLSYTKSSHMLNYYEYDNSNNLIYANQNINILNNPYNLIGIVSNSYTFDLNKDSYYTLVIKSTANMTVTIINNNTENYNVIGYKLITFKPLGEVTIILSNTSVVDDIMLLENKEFYKYEYNYKGYKTKIINNEKEILYTYDYKGNVLTKNDGNIIEEYTYDNRSNMLTKSYDNETHETYTYDNYNNNLTKTIENDYTVYTYQLNKVGSVLINNSYKHFYFYNNTGELLTSEYDKDSNNNIYCTSTYIYDDYDREISNVKTNIDNYYNVNLYTTYLNNNVETKTIGNEPYYKNEYNTNDLLESIKYPDDNNQILEITYDNTYQDRISSITMYGNTKNYIYDINSKITNIICGNQNTSIIYNQHNDIYRIYQNSELDYEYRYDINRKINYVRQIASHNYMNYDEKNEIKTKRNSVYGKSISTLYELDNIETKKENLIISNNLADSILFKNNLISFKGLKPKESNITYEEITNITYVNPTKLIYDIQTNDLLSILINTKIDNYNEIIKIYDFNRYISLEAISVNQFRFKYFGITENITLSTQGIHKIYISYERYVEEPINSGDDDIIYYEIKLRIDNNTYEYTLNDDFYFNNIKISLKSKISYLVYDKEYVDSYDELNNYNEYKIQYDYENKRLSYKHLPLNRTIEYIYDNNNRLKELDNGEYIYSKVTYNEKNLIHSVLQRFGSSPFEYENYTYEVSYGYDMLGRLTTCYLASDIIYRYTYYDNGDIKTKYYVEFEYNDKRILTKVGNNQLTYTNTYYLHTYLGKTYNWTNDKLTSYNDGSNTYYYTYNSKGLRLTKTYNSITTHFYYDEKDRLICERRNNNHTYYLYSLDGIIGFIYNNNVYYYMIDIEGKIIGIQSASGYVLARYRYSPYGDIIDTYEDSSISGISHMKYKSYYYNDESSMYYLKNRYYLPSICRFISPDNIKYVNPDDTNGYSLYSYCNNNPIMYSDPDGNLVIELLLPIIMTVLPIYDTVTFAHDMITSRNANLKYDDKQNIVNSHNIWSPYFQFGYAIYFKYFTEEGQNIKGSGFGVTAEWNVHTIAYLLGFNREAAKDTNIGSTIFDDSHEIFSFVMWDLYFSVNPLFALIDLLIFIRGKIYGE